MNDSMTYACPSWCTDHHGSAHRTEPRTVPTFDGPVPVRAFRFGDGEQRVAIGGRAYTPGQALDLAQAVLRLVDGLTGDGRRDG